ncbi:MAG: hypothetical protein AAGF11_29375 [Myxococcota bacterium]
MPWLVLSVFVLGGCIIPGNIGNDPLSDDGASTVASGSGEESGVDPSATSADSITATSAGPVGTVSTVTTYVGSEDTGGDTVGPLDQAAALAYCGVPIVEPFPGGPVYYEGIECTGGCTIDLVLGEWVDLFGYGECLCSVMACGDLGGSGTTSPTVGGSATEGTTDGGPPDTCGPFPAGMGSFTCNCEMCSIEVNNVDFEWLDTEADLGTICACMCGNAGCGMSE